jgi:hypothetical protein
MSNPVLGKCACPLCGFPNQEVRETSKTNPKPYLCCEDCHAQIFARGAKAARILKGRIEAGNNPLNDPRIVENAAPAVVAAKPAPIPQAAPTPPEAPKLKSMWDFG